jgi:hypothetical protein
VPCTVLGMSKLFGVHEQYKLCTGLQWADIFTHAGAFGSVASVADFSIFTLHAGTVF